MLFRSTHLGENVADRDEASAVTRHYMEVLERIPAAGIDAEVSVKLTQLGLDLDESFALDNLVRIADRALQLGNTIAVDMESSAYTQRTLDLYRQLRSSHRNVGLCVQAYLFRTAKDLEELIPGGGGVRMVKGAYKEPANLAYPAKRDVDESFYMLTARLLSPEARQAGIRPTIATHDPVLIERIQAFSAQHQIPTDAYEFAMLYGIQRQLQARLVASGHRLRVLISYGSYWFPWYMRRLAERPANVLFVLRGVFGD